MEGLRLSEMSRMLGTGFCGSEVREIGIPSGIKVLTARRILLEFEDLPPSGASLWACFS